MQGPQHKHRRTRAIITSPIVPGEIPARQMPAVVASHYMNQPNVIMGPGLFPAVQPGEDPRDAVIDRSTPRVRRFAIDNGLLRDRIMEKAIQAAPARKRSIVGSDPLIRMSPQHAARYRPVVEISEENIKFRPSSVADRDAYLPDDMRARAYDPFFDFGVLLHDIEGLERDVELFTKGFIDKQRMKMAAGGVVKIVAGVVHGATLGLSAPVTGPAFLAGDLLVTNAQENLRDRGAPDESGVAVTTGARGMGVAEGIKAVRPHLESGLTHIPKVGEALAVGFVPVAGGAFNVVMGGKAVYDAYKYEGFDLSKEQRKLVVSIFAETRQIMAKLKTRGAEIKEKTFLNLDQKKAYSRILRQILAPLKQIEADAIHAIKENNRVITKRKKDAEMVLGARAAKIAQKDAEERAARKP